MAEDFAPEPDQQANVGTPTATTPSDQPSNRLSQTPIDVRFSWEHLPDALTRALETVARDQPKRRDLLKDYLPVLTPIAAVVVSAAVLTSSCYFQQKTADAARSSTLSAIVTRFGQSASAEDTNVVTAMQIAIQGEEVLPAVKMVLGTDNQDLRRGAVLVATQMCIMAAGGQRSRLVKTIAGYYSTPSLQQGVAEWGAEIGSQLSVDDGKIVFKEFQNAFGPSAERCKTMDEQLALAVGQFVARWKATTSSDFAVGMVKNCEISWGARIEALNALSISMRPQFSEGEREDIATRLSKIDDPPSSVGRTARELAISRLRSR